MDGNAKISIYCPISDQAILDYINTDNYSDLAPRLQASQFSGYIPDIENLHRGAEAFDTDGFAKDNSAWVAFNYKPLPSTFWPTNGSTDDVMIRLPTVFRQDKQGNPSRTIYQLNLAVAEMTIKQLDQIDIPPTDETGLAFDLNGDAELTTHVTHLLKPKRYFGSAENIAVSDWLYPEGTEFLHTVRYVGIDDTDGTQIDNAFRMKEVRYMKKIRFLDKAQLASIYGNEDQDKLEELLPNYAYFGDKGIDNGFGWLIQGFIEDKQGDLRPQTEEETLFCMGCHTTIGSTIDQTFSFARKVTGAKGWGYIDLHNMPDAPNVGESEGEILTYLKRVNGGSEFRHNQEMQQRWFKTNGNVDEEKVKQADVYTLLAPSRERALALNKAYKVLVEEQSLIRGRDAILSPPENVYKRVDPATTIPLLPEHRHTWDIRLQWSSDL